MTPAQFRSEHGDCTTWSAATFNRYEQLLEAAHPDITSAARVGLVVVGRHAEGGRVAVDLALPGTLRAPGTDALA
ncbi:hypothetical protein AB0I82_35305 [Streptomyces sp. NPDC050315]|uniref:hypothetical protein n=1 Tax=Streptomyces sp. NPDC050315 TaxID=3155039 RepID=UPI003437DC6F